MSRGVGPQLCEEDRAGWELESGGVCVWVGGLFVFKELSKKCVAGAGPGAMEARERGVQMQAQGTAQAGRDQRETPSRHPRTPPSSTSRLHCG